MRETSAELSNGSDLHQKLRKLESSIGDGDGILTQRTGRQQGRIKRTDHGCAGTGGANDHVSVLESLNEMLRAWPRLIPVSGIESRLAATGLIFGEIDGVANPAQHLDRVHRHFRQQLVHEARDEERYFLLHDFLGLLGKPKCAASTGNS